MDCSKNKDSFSYKDGKVVKNAVSCAGIRLKRVKEIEFQSFLSYQQKISYFWQLYLQKRTVIP